MDYNEEARRLLARLGESEASRWAAPLPAIQTDCAVNRFNNLDPVFRSQQGGFIFVGGDLAARDLAGLQARGVTAVVNCTTNIECFHPGRLDFFRNHTVTLNVRHCISVDRK